MMDDSNFGGFMILVIFGMIILGIFCLLDSFSCHAKWSREFEPSYGPLQGCMIKVNGKYIPAENYRNLE